MSYDDMQLRILEFYDASWPQILDLTNCILNSVLLVCLSVRLPVCLLWPNFLIESWQLKILIRQYVQWYVYWKQNYI